MKIRVEVFAQTLYGVITDEDVRDELNDLLAEHGITSENLIDIKINTHPVFNILMSENTFLEANEVYNKLEKNADYTSTRYIATIIYKTEE